MSSKKAANEARRVFSDELFRKGINGLSVDKVRVEAEETFALVAFVSRTFRKPLPASVTVSLGADKVKVPLVVQKASEFKPE